MRGRVSLQFEGLHSWRRVHLARSVCREEHRAMPQKSLWHGFEPMPLASEASLTGCDQFRPRHQPLIHDGGRRCGDARFGNDTTSAMDSFGAANAAL